MRGAVMYAPGDVRVEDRPDPIIQKSTDAVIRLSASCICGSYLWPYRGTDSVGEPIPMGHEYVGIVEEVGSEVTTITPGQFVVGSFFASDNTCEICQAGYQTSCVNREILGTAGGAQAQRMRVPLADATLVATPRFRPPILSRTCWPPPTSSAPGGSAPSRPTSAPVRRWPWWATARWGCAACSPPSNSAPNASSR